MLHEAASESAVTRLAARVSFLLLPVIGGCADPERTLDTQGQVAPTPPEWFVEVPPSSGIRFQHNAGDLQRFEMPHIMGGGAGWLDYDKDGRADLILVDYQGGDVCYRQVAPWQFADVTTRAAMRGIGTGIGLTVGDVDADGFDDMLVYALGAVRLWTNNGDGTFSDATRAAGLELLDGFAAAGCFCDYDADGAPDLLVVNYVDYLPGQWCEDSRGRRDFCGPSAYEGTIDRLYHNRGVWDNPRLFDDVTLELGFGGNPGKGLGVACGDLTGDGRVDFFVANDVEPNHFWEQQADGGFSDIAAFNGTALNQFGEAEAGMGVVAADLGNRGTLDLYITHFSGQTNTLYRRIGGSLYSDETPQSGLGPPGLPYTGFGVAAIDVDHDGDLDLLVANGRATRGSVRPGSAVDDPLREFGEPNQFFLNDGTGRFGEAIREGGSYCRHVETSRALAVADIDNDGDVDFVVTNIGGRCRLFRNEAPKSGAWLEVRLIGTRSDRNSLAADVWVTASGRTLYRRVSSETGYVSANDVRVHFGLSEVHELSQIRVRWPNGAEEDFPGGRCNRSLVLVQGRGVRGVFDVAGPEADAATANRVHRDFRGFDLHSAWLQHERN